MFFQVVPDCFVFVLIFSFILKDDVGECILHMYIHSQGKFCTLNCLQNDLLALLCNIYAESRLR